MNAEKVDWDDYLPKHKRTAAHELSDAIGRVDKALPGGSIVSSGSLILVKDSLGKTVGFGRTASAAFLNADKHLRRRKLI